MNKLYSLLFIVVCSCSGFKELPVEYDYSYRGNFKKYKTFDLMHPLYIDSSMYSDVIEKSIATRMKFLGYKKSDTRPHLIISYKMFNDSLRLNGYEQPEMESWMRSREQLTYNSRKYTLKTGTLLIQFYDRRLNQSVWQGYSTVTYGEINFSNNREIRNAVISILDKYRVWADGFLEEQSKMQQVNP